MIPIPTPEQVATLGTAERFLNMDGWVYVDDRASSWWELNLKTPDVQLIMTIKPRPAYCDRGNFIAQVSGWRLFNEKPGIPLLDHQDAWPRYYFDFWNAVMECQAWCRKRRYIK